MKMMIEGVNLPRRKTKGSCGYDIYCPLDITIVNEARTIDTGIMMEPGDIPEGYFAMIVPRSSMGSSGLHLRNTVGIIDSDYTMDTIKATLYMDQHSYGAKGYDRMELKKNDRILQMVIVPFGTIPNEETPTEERKGGYGSTGL